MVYSYTLQIREHHLDTFGHVNNATYLQLFEEARWDILSQQGITFESIHRDKIGPVILEVHVRFLRELKNRDSVIIQSRFRGFTGKVGELEQLLKREDGEICCQAVFQFGIFDLQIRSLIAPPDKWQALLTS